MRTSLPRLSLQPHLYAARPGSSADLRVQTQTSDALLAAPPNYDGSGIVVRQRDVQELVPGKVPESCRSGKPASGRLREFEVRQS